MRIYCLPALAAIAVVAASAAPRKTLAEYPVHASTDTCDIGIEYTVHSYSANAEGADGQMYLARNFLVFEIALFPKQPVQLKDGAFELTVNNAKRPIAQVPAEFVALEVRNPDWGSNAGFEAGASMGGIGATTRGPSRVERFPGDPNARVPRSQTPTVPDDSGPKKAPVDAGQIAIESALAAHAVSVPTIGNVYFPYKGNPAKIKHLVLHISLGGSIADVSVR